MAADENPGSPVRYDAFISYSRRDEAVARALQRGMHRVGRGFGRLRALRVFRDLTDLTANPAWWPRLQAHLDASRHLVVLLSPDAAASPWVDREVAHWLAHRGVEGLILVLVRGVLVWDAAAGCFDPERSDAAPPSLTSGSLFDDEPGYVDLTYVTSEEGVDPAVGRFRDDVVRVAAPVHGRPVDELENDDRRELRRFRRYRWAAIVGLAVLSVLSLVVAVVAVRQGDTAERQRDLAQSRQFVAESQLRAGTDPKASLLLAAAAWQLADVPEARFAVLDALTRPVVDTVAGDALGVAVAPDGEVLATVGRGDPFGGPDGFGSGGDVRLWDVATHRPLGDPVGSGAFGVVFSAADDVLAWMTAGGVHLWDVSEGREVGGFAMQGDMSDMAFGPDGTTVAMAGADGSVWLWDVDSEEGRRLVEAPDLPPDAQAPNPEVAFGAHDDLLAVGNGDGTVVLWSTERDEVLAELATGAGDPITDVAVNGHGNQVAAVDQAGGTWVWGRPDATGAAARPGALTGRPRSIEAPFLAFLLEFSPDGTRLVVGSGGTSLSVWDSATLAAVGDPIAIEDLVPADLAFLPDGRHVVTTGQDGALRFVDLDRYRPPGPPLVAHEDGRAVAVAFSRDGRLLASGGTDGQVRLWSTATREPVGEPLVAAGEPVPLAVAFGRDVLAVGYDDSTVRLWDPETQDVLAELRVGDGTVDGFTLDDDGTVDEVTFTADSTVDAVAFSADGDRLAAAGEDGTVVLWDLPALDLDAGDQEPSGTVEIGWAIEAIAFSPDGAELAAGAGGGAVHVWDLDSGEVRAELLAGGIDTPFAVAYGRDGDEVVSAGLAPVHVWDVATEGHRGEPMAGHRGNVLGLARGPGGRLVASSDSDGVVLLWDLASGRRLGPALFAAESDADDVAFSPDGELLAAASGDGTVHLWGIVPVDDPAAAACRAVGGALSRAEWEQYLPDTSYVPICP